MTTDAASLKPLRTWSHLAKNRRRPTEYEVVSTDLLWTRRNPAAPFTMSPSIPVSQWFIRNREQTGLTHPDWNAFRDPDQLIYRTYTTIQDGQESYVDGLLDEHSRNDHDFGLPAEWVAQLAARHTPGRYLIHALQMSSNYLVALAPSSTVANCLMFQAGDQLRWVSRIAYRTAELRKTHPDAGFGATERRHWESSPHWRGFVELVERMLVTWDFSEQFVVLNVFAKPATDAMLRQFGDVGRGHGDTLTGLLADAQGIDGERSKRWTRALIRFLVDGEPSNLDTLRGWAEKWVPLGDQAIDMFFDGLPGADGHAEAAKEETRLFRQGLGLQ
ncbi:toluene monooxygenase [Thermopolyspora sp. NPDC052614]|uniref:toluene monooxygenase n=1 Tax=Thermopolyspora sp. NPDC052614 TaxID=3155682 RepID=UPI00343C95CE